MWSREGIQQFMQGGLRFTQKGIHLVETGVQITGTLKGAYEAGGMAVRLGGAGAPGGICLITSGSLTSNVPRDIELDSAKAESTQGPRARHIHNGATLGRYA